MSTTEIYPARQNRMGTEQLATLRRAAACALLSQAPAPVVIATLRTLLTEAKTEQSSLSARPKPKTAAASCGRYGDECGQRCANARPTIPRSQPSSAWRDRRWRTRSSVDALHLCRCSSGARRGSTEVFLFLTGFLSIQNLYREKPPSCALSHAPRAYQEDFVSVLALHWIGLVLSAIYTLHSK